MSQRSYFYRVYEAFRDGRYEDGIRVASGYRAYQTPAGFRRIYNYLVRVLDDVDRAGRERAAALRRQLARMDIQVAYQANRGVLYRDLAEGVRQALQEIMQSLQRGDLQGAAARARALRDALDAVLAYVITAKKGRGEEEEEEWV